MIEFDKKLSYKCAAVADSVLEMAESGEITAQEVIESLVGMESEIKENISVLEEALAKVRFRHFRFELTNNNEKVLNKTADKFIDSIMRGEK